MRNVTIEAVAACASEGTKDVGGGGYPFFWVQSGLDVEALQISGVYREEKTFPTPMLRVDQGATVKGLSLTDLHQKSGLNAPVPQLVLDGEVTKMRLSGVRNE